MKFLPSCTEIVAPAHDSDGGSARVLIEEQCGNIDGQSRTRLYESAASRIQSDENRADDLVATCFAAAAMAGGFEAAEYLW